MMADLFILTLQPNVPGNSHFASIDAVFDVNEEIFVSRSRRHFRHKSDAVKLLHFHVRTPGNLHGTIIDSVVKISLVILVMMFDLQIYFPWYRHEAVVDFVKDLMTFTRRSWSNWYRHEAVVDFVKDLRTFTR